MADTVRIGSSRSRIVVDILMLPPVTPIDESPTPVLIGGRPTGQRCRHVGRGTRRWGIRRRSGSQKGSERTLPG
jgi:hypothetical protein